MWRLPINIIRYLFMLRVTGSLVNLSDHPALELSLVVGNAIANRLPHSQARPWRKAVALWDQSGLHPQDLKKRISQPTRGQLADRVGHIFLSGQTIIWFRRANFLGA
ncbi:MAG: hypothetical protein HQK59_12895 [Deltaproteobacteria bacterium]|nr:hypothetical protein [Deltaproteobacteria bacterium]